MAETSGPTYMAVRELKPGVKNMNIQVMVLEMVGDLRRTKEGEDVRTFKVADKTGSINLCIFGVNGSYLKPGDICRVLRGYCALFRSSLTAYVGKGGEIKRIGEFCFPICEEPNMSEFNFPIPAQQPQQNIQRPTMQMHGAGHMSGPSTSSNPHHSNMSFSEGPRLQSGFLRNSSNVF